MTSYKLPLCVAAAVLASCANEPPATVAACTAYCSTYEEGYQWAQRANLADARNCEGGYAADFLRGCQQEVTDMQQSFAPRAGF